VKFGIFYEHQLPRPWTDDSELTLIQNALDQVELADQLGFDVRVGGRAPLPRGVLALRALPRCSSPRPASARRTFGSDTASSRPLPGYNHPARTAERVATLDLVSGGRVEFGSGESSSVAELGGFGIDTATKRAQWQEGLEVALRCMTETPFTGVEGQWVSMPPRNVVPKPVQKPHPPLWVACSRRDTILMAAEKGIGALTFSFIDPEEAEQWVGDYHRTLAEKGRPIGQSVNANIACVTPMMCAPTTEEAVARGLEGGNFFGYSLAHFYVFGDHQPGVTDVWAEFQERRHDRGYAPDVDAALAQERLGAKIASEGAGTGLRGATGTPDQIREYLQRYEEVGVDQLIFVMQAGKNRHEDICDSLELFARKVMPEFKAREEANAAAKAKRLEPVIDAVMARGSTLDVPPIPEGFTIPAMARQAVTARGDDQAEQWLEEVASDRAAGIRRGPGIAGGL
jgi:alkanesulfonate monooxygenase SsuD/methylene tetrahydromethanopterin reductase-like flavin-dependent oxidoreductase (luciferase family)